MNRSLLKIILVLGLLVNLPCGVLERAWGAEGRAPEGREKGRRSKTVLYKVREAATAEQHAALAQALDKHGFKTERKLVKGSINQAAAPADPAGEEQLAAELMATGAVEFAEPDFLTGPAGIPNDPQYPQQWHHTKINSPAAWDLTTGSASVIVAVVDTGVEATHPEFAGRIVQGYNVYDGSSNTGPAAGSSGFHGTFVSGVVAAAGNNGAGVAGMGWQVKIMPIQIMRPDGTAYISDLVVGINWAADHGAKVVNVSCITRGSSTIDSAGKYLRGKGGLLVVSAENDAIDPGYPDYPSYLAVGATDENDLKTSFSNYGAYIDLVAPGINIRSTYLGGSYATGWGTSFSAPVVSGLAALIYSINPSFTPAQVEGFIFSTCKDLGAVGEDSVFGHGRVDAGAAVQKAKSYTGNLAPAIQSLPWANPNPVTLPNATTVNVIASDSDAGPGPLVYTWSKLSGPGTVAFSSNGTSGSDTSSASFSAAGSYVLRVSVSDGAASVTGDVSVTVLANPANNLHVARIDMSLTSNPSGTRANARVYVVDQNGVAVPSATVSGNWSGLVLGAVSGITGTDGSVTLSSAKTKQRGTFTFTVTGLAKSGYNYASALNLETSDSIVKP